MSYDKMTSEEKIELLEAEVALLEMMLDKKNGEIEKLKWRLRLVGQSPDTSVLKVIMGGSGDVR